MNILNKIVHKVHKYTYIYTNSLRGWYLLWLRWKRKENYWGKMENVHAGWINAHEIY